MSEKSKELDDKIQESTENLMKQLAAGPSENYLKFMAFAGKFHKYSFGNQILIYMANPEATWVAGFKSWLKLKNPVRKGQHGMKILVPYRGTKVVERNGQDVEVPYLTFGVGTVFDISQTENPDMAPTFFIKMGENHADLIPVILDAMKAEGIKVEKAETGQAKGYSAGGEVRYCEDNADNIIATLVHEFAHELNHWGENRNKYDKHQRECHAQSIAHIVCSALGFEIAYTVDYLINWKQDVESFRKEMDIISKGAKVILEKIEAAQKKEVKNAA